MTPIFAARGVCVSSFLKITIFVLFRQLLLMEISVLATFAGFRY